MSQSSQADLHARVGLICCCRRTETGRETVNCQFRAGGKAVLSYILGISRCIRV